MRGIEENPVPGKPHERRRAASMLTRQNSRTFLEESRERRRIMAIKSREELKVHRAKIRNALNSSGGTGSTQREDSDDFVFAYATDDELPIAVAAPHPWECSTTRLQSTADLRSEGVHLLDTIALHPEGVTLADLGNELGVDWRSLIGTVRSLMNEGEIERIQQMFYAIKR